MGCCKHGNPLSGEAFDAAKADYPGRTKLVDSRFDRRLAKLLHMPHTSFVKKDMKALPCGTFPACRDVPGRPLPLFDSKEDLL